MRRLISLALLILLASCGGGNQSSAVSLQSRLSPGHGGQASDGGGVQAAEDTGGLETAPLADASLNEALAELAALPTPAGVNQALFLKLKDALREALICRAGGRSPAFLGSPQGTRLAKIKSVSQPPTGDGNRPFDLTLVNTGGDDYTLTWHEVNVGDFDNDGTVGIADITPLAMHYGEFVTDRNSGVGLIDASGDFVANIADITGIAVNYGSELAGYNIYVEGIADPLPNRDGPGELSVMRPEEPGDARVVYSYELTLTSLLDVTVVPADALGEEGVASDPAVVSAGEPAAPQGLTAAAGEGIGVGKIELAWTANAEDDLLEYRVFRRAGAGEYERIAYVLPLAEPSFGDDDWGNRLEPGILYTYYVVAVNMAGTISPPSAEEGATPYYPPPPTAPEWIEATGASDGIDVEWAAVASDYLAGYEVWRRGPGEAEFSLLLTVSDDQTGFKDTQGLVEGETYSYQVRAVDSYGRYSAYTEVVSAAYSPSGELAIVSLTTDRTTLQVNSGERAQLSVEVTDPAADITWEATAGSFTGGDTGSDVTYAPPDSGGAQQVTVTVTAERGGDIAEESIQLIITTLESLGGAVDFSAPSFSTPAEPYRPLAYYLHQEKVILLDFGAIG